MADKKISQLSSASTPLAGTEVLPIVQSSTTVKVASNDLTVRNIRANATTGILQVTGPTAASTRVMTVPDANFTVARTDAANSFTGVQTLANENLVVSTAGKGIDFSANTHAAGMTGELFNWYEEGTWTAADSSGASLGNIGAGNYTRIGRVIFWQVAIDFPNTANGSNASFSGLPFTLAGGSGAQGRAGAFVSLSTKSDLVNILQISTSEIRFYKAGGVQMTNAELSTGTLYLGGFYIV